MKKLIVSLLLGLLALQSVFANSSLNIGVEAGYNYNIINTATGWSGTVNGNWHGFDVSVPVEYRVNNWFSLNTGIRWIMRSSEYTKTSTAMPDDRYVDNYIQMHHAIDIPFTLRFSLPLDEFRLFVGGGAYVGVRVLDYAKGESLIDISNAPYGDYWDEYYAHLEFTADDNLFDAGLIAEIGTSYEFEGAGSFYILARYQYGLTSLAKDSYMAAHSYFDSISVDAGFMWRVA